MVAAYLTFNGTASRTNVTFSENSAGTGSKGGGIYNRTGTVTLTNSTLTKNSAGNGGGIHREAGTVNITNTIVALNTAPAGRDASGTLISQGYNLIGNSSGPIITGDTTGNQLNADPMLDTLNCSSAAKPRLAFLSTQRNAGRDQGHDHIAR